MHDKLMANPGDVFTGGEEMEQTAIEGNLTFEQRLQLQERELRMLELRRKTQMEEREAEREKREYERQSAGGRREISQGRGTLLLPFRLSNSKLFFLTPKNSKSFLFPD